MSASETPKSRVAAYVLSTHWDREWYQTRERLYHRFVPLVDSVLEGIGSGELTGPFELDGAARTLVDYLELRPEREHEVHDAVSAGMLIPGRWFLMPDLFQVSGESLVRNIEAGTALSRRFGAQLSRALNCCDCFGFCAQLPQIAAGFGITTVLSWRGLNRTDARDLIWRGPDGRTVRLYRMGENGYWAYGVKVRSVPDWTDSMDQNEFERRVTALLNYEGARAAGTVLLFDNIDHSFWDRDAYAKLRSVMRRPNGKWTIRHVSLDEFAAQLAHDDERRDAPLEVHEGEMREPNIYPGNSEHSLLAETLSSRLWINRENARCEALLVHVCEPLIALHSLAAVRTAPQAGDLPETASRNRISAESLRSTNRLFLNRSWDLLLQNHAHDSICGTSVDAVHEEMAQRFRTVVEHGSAIAYDTLLSLAAGAIGSVDPDGSYLVFWNPTASERTQIVETELYAASGMDGSLPNMTFIDAPEDPGLVQSTGAPRRKTLTHTHPTRAARTDEVTAYPVAVETTVPGLGFRVARVQFSGSQTKASEFHSAPARVDETVGRIDNGLLEIELEAGRLVLTHLQSGEAYRGMLGLESVGEAGTAFFHVSPEGDFVIGPEDTKYKLLEVETGPLVSWMHVSARLERPSGFNPSGEPSDESAAVEVGVRLVLSRGSEIAKAEICVSNGVDDHRLRFCFPSGCAGATHYYADAPFEVAQRRIGFDKKWKEAAEAEVETHPQLRFTAVSSNGRGLQIIAPGSAEAAVIDDEDRTIALTALRGFSRFTFHDGEPESQMRGLTEFTVGIRPLTAESQGLALSAQNHTLETRALPFLGRACEAFAPGGAAATAALVSVQGNVVLSAARMVQRQLELRLSNPGAEPEHAVISPGEWCLPHPHRWSEVRMDGQPVTEWQAYAESILVDLKPYEVRTLRIDATD